MFARQPEDADPPEQETPATTTGRAAAPGTTAAPMNLAALLEELDGDRDLVQEISLGFVNRLGSQITTLRQAIASSSCELVSREAHAIKGGAASLTATTLAGLASELELLAMSGRLDGGDTLLTRIEAEAKRLAAFLHEQ